MSAGGPAAGRPGYTIRGGRAGGRTDAERLARQARVMGAATAALVSRIGLGAGWRCLDVGCGDGQVTLALARAVGPDGRAVGVDVDRGALAVARDAARDAGLSVEFVCSDGAQLPWRDDFDLAYSRLLLSHLAEPVAVLRAMRAAVRPGGWVAVEDLFTGTLRSDPPAPALDRLQAVYGSTVRAHGGDPTIGPRLPALFTAAGLDEVRGTTVENPMTEVDDKLFLAELVANMRESMLACGAATAAELDDLRAEVERTARDPDRVFHQARIHQVAGRRPE